MSVLPFLLKYIEGNGGGRRRDSGREVRKKEKVKRKEKRGGREIDIKRTQGLF